MTAGEATGGLKFILLEVALQQAFQTTAVANFVTEKPLFSRFFVFSTTDSTKSKKLMQKIILY